MGDSTGGGQATVSGTKPNRATAPKRKPEKTPHQLRIERLFEHAHVLASGGRPGKFHDPSLSDTDISLALKAWQVLLPKHIQTVTVGVLIEGKRIREIAAAEGIEIEAARQRLAKGVMSFESLIAKQEGPDKTQDERSLVPIMRRVTADRDAPAFMMRKAAAEIEKILLPEMRDAVAEIEFCWRYLSGEANPTANLRAYGIVAGGGDPQLVEDKAIKLVPVYQEWANALLRSPPEAWVVCRAVVIDGLSLRQAEGRAMLFSRKATIRLLLSGLNDYCIRRGLGDVLGAYKQHDPGYAYVIGSSIDGPFKVGYSTKPKARLAQLQDGHASRLTLMFLIKTGILASKAVEDDIRSYLGKHQLHGDWYNAPFAFIVDGLRLIHPRATEIIH